jgi:DNA-binding CsgD family transcriptional regulator/catechol 2,3-dioxygenase-like lactoylglutathione lyase family enzyme
MKKRGRPRYEDVLTPAEWRVVQWVRHGLTNRQIAARQSISVDAVKYHVANVLQKLGVKDRGALRTWDGVPRGSALALSRREAADAQRIGALGQIARSVLDIAMSRAWYASALGLEHLYSFGDLAFFDCGGTRLMLVQAEEATPESILYFRVDEIRDACSLLSARGVEFTNAPHLIHRHADGTEEWLAFFKDLEGRSLALISQVAPAGRVAPVI